MIEAIISIGAGLLASFLIGAFVGHQLALRIGEAHERTCAEQESERLRDEIWELKSTAAARDKAEAANEAKSRFLATVSHEVRTPLNGILGMADLLASMELGAEADSYLAAIKTSGQALANLIDEILDFSRIEAGHLELEAQPFDLAPVVEGVIELLAPRAQGKGIEIAATIAANAPQKVIGDAARIRQILINLAGNAVKFTETGGVGLRVARRSDGALVFMVEDTGPGVPEERRSRIFQEFERADGSSTSAHGGAGLGLSISRAIAERMGGQLTLERSGPTGSCFMLVVFLPVVPEAQDVSLSLSGKRALIVAQSPFEAPYLGERLAAVGADIQRADGVSAALSSLASDKPPDVVIVDCALGEDSAKHIAAAARKAGAGRTLVLISPFERRAIGQTMLGAFDGWLVKPVRHASLIARLHDNFGAQTDPRFSDAPPLMEDKQTLAKLSDVSILLAEDNDINALIAQRCLERAGAVIFRVNDGVEAVAALEEAMRGDRKAFDVALLDIRMPKLDGLNAARRIRALESEAGVAPMPLVALTANAADEDRRAGEAAGFDVFLVKPFDAPRLIGAIADIVAMHKAKRDSAVTLA